MEAPKMLCPKCGKRTMVMKEFKDGRYTLVCLACGRSWNPFGPGGEKGRCMSRQLLGENAPRKS